jgi:uncharacterized protein YndB with AHSA1/START domain
MDAKVGGGYKMSFTNFSNGKSHSFGGKYVEMVPGKKLVYMDAFDDPKMPGQMKVTVLFEKLSVGTDLKVTQEGIPDMIPPELCYLGWQQSLLLLAQLAEAEINEG